MNKRTPGTLLLVAVLLAGCTNVVPEGLEERLETEEARKEAYRRAVRELWVLETERGQVLVRLFPDDAPASVAAVRQWTADGLYDGTWIHRVVREPRPFVLQGGDPESRALPATRDTQARQLAALELGYGTTEPALAPEATQRRHAAGAVALAVSADGRRAGPQFVLALADLPHLDGSEPVFGQVVGGWSVVRTLQVGDRILRARLLPPEKITGEWHADLPPAKAP